MPIRLMSIRVISLGLVLAGTTLAHAQDAPSTPPTSEAVPPAAAEPGAPLTVNPGVPLEPAAAPARQEAADGAMSDPSSSAEPASAWDYLDEGQRTGAQNEPTAEELAALDVTTQEEAERFPRLDVYGFADFTLAIPTVGKGNAWSFYFSQNPTFYVGNINLYVASQMSQTLRSLLEVRFTYLPQGKNRSTLEQTGSPDFLDNSANDYTDAERPIKLGAIEIERVQLEYAPVEWMSVVAGQWLTPYGLWNVDHGSPTTIGSHKPYVVGEQFLPERQTGVLIQGSTRIGTHRFGYNLGISNGRGPLDAYYDMDKNKAGTLHLSWQSNSVVGDVAVGASGYLGRFTSSSRTLGISKDSKGNLVLSSVDTPTIQYDEHSLAADVKWVKGGFQTFAEVVLNQKRYTKRGRPVFQDGLLSLVDPIAEQRIQPDTQQVGGYLIAGYRFQWFGVMPFTEVEYVYRDSALLPKLGAFILGLNIRPHESLTLKVSWGIAWFPDASPRGPGRDSYQNFDTQIAWAF